MSENRNNLFGQFMHIQWLFNRHHHQNQRAFGPMGNPYRGQGRVLKLLKMQPEISQKDLSELLDMRPQSLGELLAKLERNGYITRIPSEDDKRVMVIRLAEKGAEAGNEAEEQPDLNVLFSCLSEEEQVNLQEYLDRIISKLENEFADGQDWPGYRWHDGRGREHGHKHGHEHDREHGHGREHGNGREREHGREHDRDPRLLR